jgi:type II secretory pathway component GspD/PulD (secretin)
MRAPLLAIALYAVLAVPTAFAGEPASGASPTPKPAAGDENLIQLNFPENLEVKALVDFIGKRLGMNILYDDAVVRKRITIAAPAKVPTESLLGLLQSVLKMTGLALVDSDQPGWKKIVSAQSLLSVSGRIQEDPQRLTATEAALAVTQVFPLKHVSTSYIEQMIKPFLSAPGGNSFSVEDQRLVIVTDYAENLRRAAQMIELLDRPGKKGTVKFVNLKNREAADLAKQVNALLQEKRRVGGGEKAGPPGISITHEPRTNQIVVISTEGTETDALELIQTLDVPTGQQTRTYRVQNISPQRIDKLARDSFGSDGQAPYKATVDPDSGLLIITAPSAIHEKIAALIQELDVAAPQQQGYVRFYRLVNVSAADVLATIRALEGQEGGLVSLSLEQGGVGTEGAAQPPRPALGVGPNVPPGPPGAELPKPPAYKPPPEKGSGASGSGSSGGPSGGPTSGTPAPAGPPTPATLPGMSSVPTSVVSLSGVPSGPGAPGQAARAGAVGQANVARTRNAVVAVDTNTNSIIVVAPPAVQAIYKQLIDALDKRRPQVMIEVTMVTLDTSDNFSLGIELSAENTRPDLRWLTFSSFGLSTLDLTTAVPTILPGAGFNGVVLDPGTANVVIRALATNARAKVLSAPRILVNDNNAGTLTSVAESPFTSVNASSTVATTSFAGYASAGTTVAVTPHISEGDYLRLDYSLTLNSFTGTAAGGVPPPRQTNSIDSKVVVPDGHTVIVGGLKRQDLSDTVNKLPFIGDIPGLGLLFSNVTKRTTESSLFVFIRPVILRDDQFKDLKYLSEIDSQKAELPSRLPTSRPMGIR